MARTPDREIELTRASGHVRRAHTFPHIGEYTVGKHSFDALSLLFLLNPEPSLRLVKAVLWHDLGERVMGDLPAPAKWNNPELAMAYEGAERKALATDHPSAYDAIANLTTEERIWLKTVDLLELLLWCNDQTDMTKSQEPVEVAVRVIDKLKEMGDTLPEAARGFLARGGLI